MGAGAGDRECIQNHLFAGPGVWSLTRKMVCKYLFSIRWIVDIYRVGGGSEPNNNISLRARVGKGELIGGACESVLSIRAKTLARASHNIVIKKKLIL